MLNEYAVITQDNCGELHWNYFEAADDDRANDEARSIARKNKSHIKAIYKS